MENLKKLRQEREKIIRSMKVELACLIVVVLLTLSLLLL